MLSSTLENIKILFYNNKIIPDEKITVLLNLLSHYKKNTWIYPGVIIRKVNISMRETFEVLNMLRKHGYLELNYELHCPICQKTVESYFSTFNSIPKTYECEECARDFNALENSYMIYKVVVE